MTAGKKLRLLRTKNNWSQEVVAEKLGLSTPAYCKIESGITDINLSRLEQITGIFGLSITSFLAWDGESDPFNLDVPDELIEKLLGQEAEIIFLKKKIIELLAKLDEMNSGL